MEERPQPIQSHSSYSGLPSSSVARRAKSYDDVLCANRPRVQPAPPSQKESKTLDNQLDSDADLEDWFHGLSKDLMESSHTRYRLYRDQLRLSRQHLESILDDASSNLELLSNLSTSFKAVEAQTSAFQARCEDILEEQKRLTALANGMSENLQYYNFLEPMTRRLNAPGAGHFVRGDDFLQMLSNLDRCLEYMQAHPNHREAATYQARYRLLLTRALTLIRVHFTNTLREISADVSKRVADRQLTDTTMSALLYAKFRVGAPELKQLGLEIQKRARPSPDTGVDGHSEYQNLMNELHQSYSAARGRLLVPLIRKKLADSAAAPNTSKDLVTFSRSTISYIRGICMDEFDLWHEWFVGESGLYEYLEAMCEPLFDYLRPRTIHETQLPKLCELCSIIQVRYMEEQDDDSEPTESNQLDFSYLIRPALEDAQTRLVFVAMAVLRDEIERYKPKPADLEVARTQRGTPLSGAKERGPALSGRKSSMHTPQSPLPKTPTVVEEEGTDPLDLRWRYDTKTSYSEWYPTLRKAIWLLSKIYRLVNSTVFDDLAHQIVHQTTLSLHQAATQVKAKTTATDSQLFLLKELLILKQQIVAFDIEFVAPEVNFDFSDVMNTFWELRERGGLFNPRNILRLVGSGLMPRVVENMLDAKAELDGRLRTVIKEFTNGYAERMTSAISEAASNKKDFHAGTATKAVRNAIEKEVPLLRAKLLDYLDDVRIRETLVSAVQDQVLQNYEAYFDRVTSQALANGNPVSKKGKGREDDAWDPDTFADWTSTVFGIGRVGPELEEDSGAVSPALSAST